MTQILWTYPEFHLRDEEACVQNLLKYLDWDDVRAHRVSEKAAAVITAMRNKKSSLGEIETMLNAYPLHTEEGMALMTLAESVLRIPDKETLDELIAEKLSQGTWDKAGGEDIFTHAAGTGLALAHKTLNSMLGGMGKPVIRKTITEVIRRMGGQFVLGETIEEAMKEARAYHAKKYRLSYDMLGEGARTYHDSRRYFESYATAIKKIGEQAFDKDLLKNPGMSVKLSALHPRYIWSRAQDCVPSLVKDMVALAVMAKDYNITLTMDAEESDRLDLSLNIFSQVRADPLLQGWDGLGLAVQAYDKRAFTVIDDIAQLAKKTGSKIQVRLVKGAYWDSEIKKTQMAGLSDYPVFTRKENTDLSYVACAQKLLSLRDVIYPMFATHNAHTACAIIDMAGNDQSGFEFQRLHGMGEALGDKVVENNPVTIYAPVGAYADLLPYLVRRMLENGASTSFVQHVRNENMPSQDLAQDIVTFIQKQKLYRHPSIPLPKDIFSDRKNSQGFDVADVRVRHTLHPPLKIFEEAAPLIKGQMAKVGSPYTPHAPHDISYKLPSVFVSSPDQVATAFHVAQRGFEMWSCQPASRRAEVLNHVADCLESNAPLWIARLQVEAGKTLNDAIAELREAIDFCRYYATEGKKLFDSHGIKMPGYTGEDNYLTLHGRGVFVCISPWNFPLAIFVGQIAAALMAGNAVICKPAEQTPLIAYELVKEFLAAGIPPETLTLLLGDGSLGAALVAHKDVAGVAFTGSTAVARAINRALAAKDGPIVPFIAETGGQNVMIVDSTALLEQTVDDIVLSAFGSAGQRCSALRVVYIQKDIFAQFEHLLKGVMSELKIGNPCDWGNDIGPVIDRDAQELLQQHLQTLDQRARKIFQSPDVSASGFFIPPAAYEIPHLDMLDKENFGPILHVISYESQNLEKIIHDINNTGYGLTFGIQSRLQKRATYLGHSITAGNIYINRSMTGAVVGVQPFGGMGLSGTGPKAGGPYYLHRFAHEKTITNNISALGGNVSLLLMKDDR